MKPWVRFIIVILAVAAVIGGGAVLLSHARFDVLNPQGIIASKQRELMLLALALSAIVVIPVFAMTIWIVWRYRATPSRSPRAVYLPNWDHSRVAETIWWVVPLLIIVVLSVVTWVSTHELDPYRPLASNQPPLKVQVVALPWKWLFIYPEQNIATVNYLELPVGRPVEFTITSDAPMNSFWIPQLGGQVYAMAGMSTKLHLQADKAGEYRGSSANLSGQGFAGMRFVARATSPNQFDAWAARASATSAPLDGPGYVNLAAPSSNTPEQTFSPVRQNLYDDVVMKYMMPTVAGDLTGASR